MVLIIPRIGRPSSSRDQLNRHVAVGIVRVGRAAAAVLFPQDLIRRVISIGSPYAAVDLERAVAHLFIGVSDIVAVGARALFVCQLIRVVVAPGHADAADLDHSLAIAHRINGIIKARNRGTVSLDVCQPSKLICIIITNRKPLRHWQAFDSSHAHCRRRPRLSFALAG